MPTDKGIASCQVAILGGGPAGCACAIALTRMGIRDVLLVEAGDYTRFCIGESIPPETRPLLARLGILESFLAEGHEPCHGSRSYWGDHRRGHNDALFSVYGHGWHLDRTRFNRFMAREAQHAGAEVITRSTFKHGQELDDGRFRLSIETEQGSLHTIDADFVVDATGPQGAFVRLQGSKKIMDRPLLASGMRFSLKHRTRAMPKITHLEAVEYGWWYAAPLPNDTMMVMLVTDAETVKSMGIKRAETWMNLLQATPNTAAWIATAENIDPGPMHFFVPSFVLDKLAGRRWMAVGDTASAYDPISSQGIIKAISDAIFAAETIAPYLRGQTTQLEDYQRAIVARYLRYVEVRDNFYRIETRWPDSAFWQRQQGTL